MGENCKYSREKTCSNNGTPDINGNCIRDSKWVTVGNSGTCATSSDDTCYYQTETGGLKGCSACKCSGWVYMENI